MKISEKETGRDWGDKIAPRFFKRVINGITYDCKEADYWDGPINPGQRGQYLRIVLGEPVE